LLNIDRKGNQYLLAGEQRLVGDTYWEANDKGGSEMHAENGQLKTVVAELTLQNRVLTLSLEVCAREKSLLGRKQSRAKDARNEAEKQEIIHLVEHSSLSMIKTWYELPVPRSTFSRWFDP
jgi:hypothetical protein